MRIHVLATGALGALLCAIPALADAPVATAAPTVASPPATDGPIEAPRAPVGSIGVGPTYFGMIGNGVQRYGVALDLDASVPLDGRLGLDVHFAWGLTEFHRFDDFTNAGYRAGAWTTKAYEDVWNWAATNDQWALFRWIGAFFAFAGLAFPYIGAGVCYVLAPVAPTTYLELDLAAIYELGDKNANPYFKGGLGLVGYLHPLSARPSGGVGPTVAFGARLRGFDVSAQLTWLPYGLHGEDPGERTNVVIGGLTMGLTR
jgi:hypothetical protein